MTSSSSSSGGIRGALWAHPPLPPGKRILDRSISEDRKPPGFGFMRKFPSVRRRNSKKDCSTDTTYESFDSLFEDNDDDIVFAGTEYVDDENRSYFFPQSTSVMTDASGCKNKPFATMFRSRSDGNLSARRGERRGYSNAAGSVLSHESPEPKGFTKYLRALSGSWKNLLNSKLDE